MQFSTLLLSLLPAATTLALPHSNIIPSDVLSRSSILSKVITNIKLPSSGLTPPDSSLALKYVALGIGTQNYSCETTPKSSTAAPASGGAVADLYDATPLLSKGSTPMKANMEKVLPGLALSLSDSYGLTPDKFPGPVKCKHFGKHLFTLPLVPTFMLNGASPKAQIMVNKTGNVAAPADACPGTDGEGAVDWLQLVDNGNGYSKNTPLAGGAVYRVETAGGKAPATCAAHDGKLQVKYATLYFLYGKK